jgi:hypothetical protein
MLAGIPADRIHNLLWRTYTGSDASTSNAALLKRTSQEKADAFGWACASPEFIAAGFVWDSAGGRPKFADPEQDGKAYYASQAVARFFGLSEAQTDDLMRTANCRQPAC